MRFSRLAVAVLLPWMSLAEFERPESRLDEPVWPELASEFKAGESFKPRGKEIAEDIPFSGEEFKPSIATSVEMVNGTPTFMLNSKPFFAMWGSSMPIRERKTVFKENR